MKFQDQVVASPSKMFTSDYITPKAALLNYGNYCRTNFEMICLVFDSRGHMRRGDGSQPQRRSLCGNAVSWSRQGTVEWSNDTVFDSDEDLLISGEL